EILSLLPNDPDELWERAIGRVSLALLVVFPYLLFRFTTAFRSSGRRLANALAALTAILVVWTFVLPKVPQSGEHWSVAFDVYVAAFMVHWTVLATVSALRLWRAGAEQPAVARRRMQLLAIAAAALVVAILLLLGAGDQDSVFALVVQILGVLSAVAFLLGL